MGLKDALLGSPTSMFADIESREDKPVAPTGFTIIDTLYGSVESSVDDSIPVFSGGLYTRFGMSAGESSTGKSTLTIQMACASADWWNEHYKSKNGEELSDVVLFDCENNTELSRVMSITGWTSEKIQKHFILSNMTDIIEINKFLVSLADIKKKSKDKYYVKTDLKDFKGDPLWTWINTYVIIDSVAALKGKTDLDDYERDREGNIKFGDQIGGNMDAMRSAKTMQDFIVKIKPILDEVGISLIMINHIIKEVSINPYESPKKVLPFLRAGEKLKGGAFLVYQAFSISNLIAKEKLDAKNPVYGDDIYGIISNFGLVKSKSSADGVYYRMVFNTSTGYSALLSDFDFLYENSYGIEGTSKIVLTILPEIVFTRKTLYDTCKKHPILARAIKFTAKTKMIHDIKMREKAPTLTHLKDVDLSARIAMILSFTEPYPGMEKMMSVVTDDETLNLMARGLPKIDNTDIDRSNAVPTSDYINGFAPNEDGFRYMPSLLAFSGFNHMKMPKDTYVDIIDKELGRTFRMPI